MLTWVLGLAVGCVVLAGLLHFVLPAGGGKVPAVVIGTVGGFVAGAVLGMLGAVMYGETVQKSVYGAYYEPEPMGGNKGARPGFNTPPSGNQAPGTPKKEAAGPAPSGGPGSTNLRSDYPGVNDAMKKGAGAATPAK